MKALRIMFRIEWSKSKIASLSVVSNNLWSHGLQTARFLCPWNSPGKNTGVGCYFLLQGMFLNQGLNLGLLHCRQILYHLSHEGSPYRIEWSEVKLLSPVRLFETPRTVAYQTPLSMGFSRQEYWRGLPFPSPGDLPNPGIEPRFPAFEADALTSEPPGKQAPDK